MEEILASIRRIISEDDAPSDEDKSASAEPSAKPDPEPELEAEPAHVEEPPALEEEEVLELVDIVPDHEPPAIDDIEAVAPPPVIERRPEPPLPPLAADEPLVGAPAAHSAASAFEALERSILMPADGRTLEDVVRELLRPMLKAWLDENLPGIVEAQVQAEVERIARLRR